MECDRKKGKTLIGEEIASETVFVVVSCHVTIHCVVVIIMLYVRRELSVGRRVHRVFRLLCRHH